MAKLKTACFLPGLSGATGSAVFVQMPDGSVYLRGRPVVDDPDTEAQRHVRGLMRRAARAFRALSAPQQRAWLDYAEEEARRNRREGQATTPRAYNLFTGLAYQVLRIDPGATIPVTPPASPFSGDAPSLSVESVPGAVRFTADAPNGLDVVTELMLARVRSSISLPNPRAYRHQAFVRFVPGSLSVDVPLEDNPYAGRYVACAARYLRSSTGQAAGPMVLGVVEVPG
ncbi:MAG: hypothetical protein KIT11_06770 [Fimbriimonadaceae bacterium]|nr:hypothetical protein [Fimbriimonadaceae bacterium]QYK56056.1 MAG: hypothetical protein KF733_00960 [Fimbriimonadaceae bacterium]